MKYVWNGTEFVPKERQSNAAPYIQPDIQEYGGRAKFREHLKKTGTIELGHSDMAAGRDRWESRKSDFQKRISGSSQKNTAAEKDIIKAPDYQRSRLNAEMANRLDGRPIPDRKMLLKLTLETARSLNRR